MATNIHYSPKEYLPGAAMAAEPLGWEVLAAAHVRVTHVAAATGVATVLINGTHYTIAGNLRTGAGTITALAVYPALDVFRVERVTDGLQRNNLNNQENLPVEDIERELDRLSMVDEEAAAIAASTKERTLLVAEGAVAPPVDLSNLVNGALLQVKDGKIVPFEHNSLAGKFYAGDENGLLIGAVGVLDTVPITSFGEAFVANETAAEALADLGLSGPDGSKYVVNKSAYINSLPHDLHKRFAESLTGVDAGIICNGSTNNTSGWQLVQDWALERGEAGNSPHFRLQPGRCVYSSMANLAVTGFVMEFLGESWLINTGTGPSFTIDGGATGAGVYGMKIVGRPRIYGEASSAQGVYARAVFNSTLEFNIRGAGASSQGFYAEKLVDNDISLVMSGNEGGIYSSPATQVHLTQRGVGEESSYNRMSLKIGGPISIDPIVKAPLGLLLDGALGNIIQATIQNCVLGMEATPNAWDNCFIKFDCEGNTKDALDNARRTNYLACDADTLIEIGAAARGARLIGGRVESVDVKAGAKNTVLDMSFNRTGAGTLTDNSPTTVYGNPLNIATEEFVGKPKSVTPLPVTTGSYLWTNDTGSAATVIVRDGVVVHIAISHGSGGIITGAISGAFVVPNTNTIEINNTSVPEVFLLAGGRY